MTIPPPSIIPHPEPPEDQVNHFLRPLIGKLDVNWHRGVWYSRTYERPRGCKVHSGVATSVNDLPGSRKVSGHASHSSNNFCALCKLKRDEINNLSVETWQKRTREELAQHAAAWRDAPNKTTRKKLYKKNGVRWSEFWRLSYWDPTKFVVIDGMHSLFLRIVQHHLRVFLGMDVPSDSLDDDPSMTEPDIGPSTEKALTKLGEKLAKSCSTKAVESFSKAVLWEACHRYGVDTSHMSYKKVKKRTLSNALLVSEDRYGEFMITY